MKLILPVAGQSSRFPNMRPKWLLTHPNGNFMLIEAISQIDFTHIQDIIVVSTQALEEKYTFADIIQTQLKKLYPTCHIKVILLEHQTKSQSETVAEALKVIGGDFPFVVKDSDNQFAFKPFIGNYICVEDLNNVDLINPRNKSYVQVDTNNNLINIIEKNVVSPLFCVGGYAFTSSETFIQYYTQMKEKFSGELYISNIIYNMLLDKKTFQTCPIQEYVDWGTIEEWNRYKSEYATLFIDIDGTLVYNSGEHFKPIWGETDAIAENVHTINQLHQTGKVEIILTTARKESFAQATYDQLKRLGIQYDRVIFGLFHGKRIIINDYAQTNPYKSCDAINIKRNASELTQMLQSMMPCNIVK